MRTIQIILGLGLSAGLLTCVSESESPATRQTEQIVETESVDELAQPTAAQETLTSRRARLPLGAPDVPLPPAMRQTREGYWLGAMISTSDVPTLQMLGIRVVLSAVEPDPETLRALEYRGIEQVSVPIGDVFLHGDTILDVADRHEPSEIFVHCQHGADRTGAIAAFLLVTRHSWLIPDAFYSVLYQTQEDADGLAEVLTRYDLPDWRSVDDPTVGFYAEPRDQGMGGLKTHSEGYRRLVETTLNAIEAVESERRTDDWTPWDGRID